MKDLSSLAAISSSSLLSLRSIVIADDSGCNRRQASIIVAKKYNKKPKRSSSAKGPEPPRITSNLKQNLRILKLSKEVQKNRSTAKPATSYRKKKAEKEELPEDTELYKDPTLTLYYSTNQVIGTAKPVLLVDGYNVCGFWPKLKEHFMNGRLLIARQKLIHELATLSASREVKVVVVFDAMMSGLPMHKETFAGVDVVFSTKTSADTWIEKEIVALREDGCPEVWVATSDRLHQLSAYEAGAFVWSCKTLVSEINAAHEECEMILKEQRSTSMEGKLLKHNLDSKVVDALMDLRNKLSENERRSTNLGSTSNANAFRANFNVGDPIMVSTKEDGGNAPDKAKKKTSKRCIVYDNPEHKKQTCGKAKHRDDHPGHWKSKLRDIIKYRILGPP